MIRHLISPSRPHKPKRPPSRTARSFNLQSFPASAGPISRSPTHDSKPPSPPTSHPHPAAAGPGRNEHWRRSPNPLAQQRESSSSPEPTCECRTDPAEPRRGTDPQHQPRHSATAKQSRAPRGYAAFLQNAPVVRHTRGFTPGWYRGRDGCCRPPLPPNRTGGFPASGSPVGESPACGGTGTFG
jgi:hypothetical protein